MELVANDIALDNSNHTLSAICWLRIDGYWRSGKAIYLPPTQIPVEESLDVLLQIYGKTITKETFPDWTYEIQLPKMEAIKLKLQDLRKENLDLEERINTANREKVELENHYRLIVSKGHLLEDAVYEAFKLLGFGEIVKKRDIGKEDWVFEFSTLSSHKYGVIEVKGSDTNIGLEDLRQCENWASDYLEEYDANVKGIFVPNQYRREEYPASRSNRLHFEPNQIQYAEKRDICIIPSCVVFEGIVNLLSTGNTDRKQVENRIAYQKGVLNNLI